MERKDKSIFSIRAVSFSKGFASDGKSSGHECADSLPMLPETRGSFIFFVKNQKKSVLYRTVNVVSGGEKQPAVSVCCCEVCAGKSAKKAACMSGPDLDGSHAGLFYLKRVLRGPGAISPARGEQKEAASLNRHLPLRPMKKSRFSVMDFSQKKPHQVVNPADGDDPGCIYENITVQDHCGIQLRRYTKCVDAGYCFQVAAGRGYTAAGF